MTLFGDDAVAMGAVESPDVNRGTILAACMSTSQTMTSFHPTPLKLTSLCPPIQHCSLFPLGHYLLVGDAVLVFLPFMLKNARKHAVSLDKLVCPMPKVENMMHSKNLNSFQ